MKTVLILLFVCKSVRSIPPIVKVEHGTLSGTEYRLLNGKNINAFFGVPYAAPPISEYRFQEPQKLESWEGTRDASSKKSGCLQIMLEKNSFEVIGNEDCLHMNIFTPKLPNDEKNPLLNVLVFITSGGFMFGSGNELFPDPILGMDDVVLVFVNHRLGVMGYLSTDDNESPGNFGLKDQTAALKWVKKNIINFGGNPESVTIAGNSAGAASVHYHMISSTTEDLFQRAISLSGTSLNAWALPKNMAQKSKQLANLLKCPTTNSYEMVKCLRKKPAKKLISAYKYFSLSPGLPVFFFFGPVVEPENSNPFLSDVPYNLIKSGKIKDIPWLIGMVKDEGLFPTATFLISEDDLDSFDKKWNEFAPILLQYDDIKSKTERNKISSKIKRFYFGKKPISTETRDQLIKVVGDREFFTGIINGTMLHNMAIKNNVYCQKFNYRGERSFTTILTENMENYGVCHGDDVQYFMKLSPTNAYANQSDKSMSKLISSIIVNFMNSGNPKNVVPSWEPILKKPGSDMSCLNINSDVDLKMENIGIDLPKYKFWKTVFNSENIEDTENSSHKQSVAQLLLAFAILMSTMLL